MADTQDDRKKQSAYERLGRTERQNEGYDEAPHGGERVPPSDVAFPRTLATAWGDEFDRAARDAANDVGRQDKSAG